MIRLALAGTRRNRMSGCPHAEGEPTPVEVKTGVTDGTFTEVVDGPLKEGDEVIVGLEVSRGSQNGPGGSSLPPGFGPRPR